MLIVEFVLCFVEIMHSNSRALKLEIWVQAIRVQEFKNYLLVKEVQKKVEYCLSYTIAKRPALQSDPMIQKLYNTFLGA
jgi:hypothetical protein